MMAVEAAHKVLQVSEYPANAPHINGGKETSAAPRRAMCRREDNAWW